MYINNIQKDITSDQILGVQTRRKILETQATQKILYYIKLNPKILVR